MKVVYSILPPCYERALSNCILFDLEYVCYFHYMLCNCIRLTTVEDNWDNRVLIHRRLIILRGVTLHADHPKLIGRKKYPSNDFFPDSAVSKHCGLCFLLFFDDLTDVTLVLNDTL